MPTYRKAGFGHDEVDGLVDSLLASNFSKEECDQLNDRLRECNILLIIKPHPMDSATLEKFKELSNICCYTTQEFPQGGGRYSHIIVDEFQDINPLDLSLIKAISEYHGHGEPVNLTIVGDDDQAIFGWRGTTPKFILEPEKYFGVKFETCILETNYRSPKDIVEPACRLISRNRQRIEKEMKSAAKGRAYLKVVSRKRLAASMEAVMTTVRKILENVNGGTVALIGRKQTALFPYQVMLSAEGIRYRVDADIDIFEGEAMQILQYIMRTIYRAKIDDNDKPNRIKIHFPGKSQPKVSCRRTQHCARTIPCPICYGKQTAGFPVNK